MLERAQEFLDELPPGIKTFTLSTGRELFTTTTFSSSSSSPSSSLYPWSVLSPFWVMLCNEVAALSDRLSLLYASLKGVVSRIRGEVMEDELAQQLYKALAENMAPEPWKVRVVSGNGRQVRCSYRLCCGW